MKLNDDYEKVCDIYISSLSWRLCFLLQHWQTVTITQLSENSMFMLTLVV